MLIYHISKCFLITQLEHGEHCTLVSKTLVKLYIKHLKNHNISFMLIFPKNICKAYNSLDSTKL